MKVRKFGDESEGFMCINCPGCKEEHVIATIKPFSNGAKWSFNSNFEKPTFRPSLLIRTGKYVDKNYSDELTSSICHSYIVDGKIQFLNDCTHELKGQTVDLLDIINL
jgi:hypothetical protein